MPYYENQEKASNELLQGIKTGERYQILVAQMQSGKTTTYFLTAFRALYEKLVDNVIIFTGNRETELREQCEADFEARRDEFVDYLVAHGIKERFGPILTKIRENVKIYWGQDLATAPRIKEKTLLIWEESHYAQSVDNQPDYFRQRNLFDVSSGHSVLNEKADIYIISISATPFSEVSDQIHYSQGKRIVKMEPGEGYKGVEHYYEKEAIKPVYKANWKTILQKAMTEWLYNSPRYHIFRGTEKGKDPKKEYMMELAKNLDYDILEHTSARSDLYGEINGRTVSGLSYLEKKPERHTIVYIKQMCRMGKVVPKHHIGFVFESSNDSNTDTILQGLLGRMCGYDYGGNEDIEIYISDACFNEVGGMNQIDRYISFFNTFSTIPDRAMNVSKLVIPRINRQFTKKRYPELSETELNTIIPYDNVPVIIPREKITSFLADSGSGYRKILPEEILEAIKSNRALFDVQNYPEHVDELFKLADCPNNILNRCFKETCAYIARSLDSQILKAISDGKGLSHWTDVDKITVCQMLKGYKGCRVGQYELRVGDIVIMWAVNPTNKHAISQQHNARMFAKATGTEVFGHKTLSEDDVIYSLPYSCYSSMKILNRILEHIIHTFDGIHTMVDKDGRVSYIQLDKSVYGSRMDLIKFFEVQSKKLRVIFEPKFIDNKGQKLELSAIKWKKY